MEKIEKAREAPIGAIHTWRDGLQYIKRDKNHWVPYRYDYSRGNIDPKKEVAMIDDGNMQPIVATTDPKIPAILVPTNVAPFMAIGPGVICEIVIRSVNSLIESH